MDILNEIMEHYTIARQDNDTRKTRKNGWDEILREYHGVFPDNWPYEARVHEPVVRTAVQEKNSRLFNAKLKGKLIPREGGDVVKATINNALLDFQWDRAQVGGSMLEKWAMMDIQTRLFGASFGLVYWNVCDDYEGNEFKVLNNYDVMVDYTSTHVKNANWVQVREYKTLAQLEEENKKLPGGMYKGLKELKRRINDKSFDGFSRASIYTDVTKQVRGLEDRVGTDKSFPTLEIVTEYRKERWITFVPAYAMIIRDIENPYNHEKIPVVQLRYYPTGDDVYGDSEIEPVLGLARAINAVNCGYLDAMNLSMNPPIKVANGQDVRLDTLQYRPRKIWLTGSSPNNVMEHRVGDSAITQFRTAKTALKSAFDVALGETSQGVSGIDPTSVDKTATEINDTAKQRLARDQQNQIFLQEAIKDQMLFWVSNNQQFIFSDPSKEFYLLRVIGEENMKLFKELGLGDTDIPREVMNMIQEKIMAGEMTDEELRLITQEMEMPTKAVITNPRAKNPLDYEIKPKFEEEEGGEYGKVYITPEDMQDVTFDYIPDVKSMQLGEGQEQAKARMQLLQLVMNPAMVQQLGQEGKALKISEIVLKVMQDLGETNPQKFIQDINAQLGTANAGGPTPMGINPAQGIPNNAQPVGPTIGGAIPQPQGQNIQI